MNNFTEAVDSSFSAEVLQCDVTIITHFWAEWSAPSKQIEPQLKELAAEYGQHIKIVKMEIEANPVTVSHYEVLTVPTLIIFKNGIPIDRLVGVKPKAELMAKLLPYMPTEL